MILPHSLIFIFGLSYLSSYDQIIKKPRCPLVRIQTSLGRPRSGRQGRGTAKIGQKLKPLFFQWKQLKTSKAGNHRNQFEPKLKKHYLVAGY